MPEETKNPNETPDKNSVGRPSELTADAIKTARYYLENWNKLDADDVIPTIEGLALYLEVSRKTLYNWAKDEANEEFLHIFEKIQSMQAKILLTKGLKGVFNSTITKLMLTKHDYHDKQETELTGNGLKIQFSESFKKDAEPKQTTIV